MAGSSDNGTSRLPRMHQAISRIAAYYKLSNVMTDHLVSADPNEFQGETPPDSAGIPSGDVLALSLIHI